MVSKKDLIALLLISTMVFLMRYPSVYTPTLEWDESVYINVAENLMSGGIPYKDAWDHKPPLIYFLFSAAFVIFGKSIASIHIFTIVIVAITSLLIFFLIRNRWGFYAGFFAGTAYSIFSSANVIGGLASNTEIFMNLPIVAGIYTWTTKMQNRLSDAHIILSGLFIGIGALIKPPAVFVLLVFIVFLLYKNVRIKKLAYNIFLLMSGFMIPVIIITYYFYINNALSDFLYANIEYNINYTNKNIFDLLAGWNSTTVKIMRSFYLLFLLALTSIFFLLVKVSRSIKELPPDLELLYLITLWLIFSVVGIFSGTQFAPHYYIQLLPSLCIVAGYPIKLFSEWRAMQADKIKSNFLVSILVIFLLIGFLIPVSDNLEHTPFLLFNYKHEIIDEYRVHAKEASNETLQGIIQIHTGGGADTEAVFISEYIKLNSNESDSIFIWGSQPIIYFLSERKPSTKYVHWIHINNNNIPGSEEYVIEELREKKPKYMVVKPGYYLNFEKILYSFVKSNYSEKVQINKQIFIYKYIS